MIKVIDIAGIQLDNYSVREAILALERELSDQGFHTIEEVNTDTLMLAATDPAVRTALEAMEHTVISEVAVLDALGAGTYQRRREVENHDFFRELMRLMERNRKKVCIIGDEEERILAMEEMLRGMFPRCELVSLALEYFEGTSDSVINEINFVAPNVILSILPSPLQEQFFLESRGKLSANLWYGIGRMDLKVKGGGIFGLLNRYLRARKIKKQVHSLRQESVEDGHS